MWFTFKGGEWEMGSNHNAAATATFRPLARISALGFLCVLFLTAANCDGRIDLTLGTFTPTGFPVPGPVTLPHNPPTTGPWAGTQVIIHPSIANGVPIGGHVVVSGSTVNDANLSATDLDVAAGSAVELEIRPDTFSVYSPGISIILPVDLNVLVAQGFATSVSGLSPAILESAIFVSRYHPGNLLPIEILRPTPGTAKLQPTATVQIDGITGYLPKARFQCFIDRSIRQTYDSEPAAPGFQVPAGAWFGEYGPVTLTAEGGWGHAARALSAAQSPPPPPVWTEDSTVPMPAGLLLSAGGVLSGRPETLDPSVASTATFAIRVADSAGRTATRAFTMSISGIGIGVITTASIPSATVGQPYGIQLAVAGPAGNTPSNYTWTISSGLESSGLAMTTTGEIVGIPLPVTGGSGTFTFTVTATEIGGTVAGLPRSFTLEVHNPLMIATASLPLAIEGSMYVLNLVTAGGKPPLTYAVAQGQLPIGLTLSPSGLLSGTPPNDDPQSFVISVTDSANPPRVATRQFTLDFQPIDDLMITTTSLPSAAPGLPYFASIDTTGGRQPLVFTITTGSLPPGLTMTSFGTIGGTPIGSTSSSFTVTVTDSDTPARTASRAFTISFNAGPQVITSVTGTSGTVNLNFSFTDSDAHLSTSAYSASFSYSLATGPLVPMAASAVNPNGVNLAAVLPGQNYTVLVDTSYTLAGLRLGANAPENVNFWVTITDNQHSNFGSGGYLVTVNNTQVTPGTSSVIVENMTVASGFAIELKIHLLVAPGAAVSSLQYDIVYDTNLFDLVLPISSPPGFPRAYDDGPVLPAAAKSGTASNPTPGTIRVVVSALNTFPIGNGHIGTIKLTVKPGLSPQHTTVAVQNVVMSSPMAAPVTPRAGVAGTVIIN